MAGDRGSEKNHLCLGAGKILGVVVAWDSVNRGAPVSVQQRLDVKHVLACAADGSH